MSTTTPKRILACIRCSERRVKCDRLSPCASCIKHNVNCEYRLRKPRVTRNSARSAPREGSAERSQASIVDDTSILVDLDPAQTASAPRHEALAIEIEDGPPKPRIISTPRNDILAVEINPPKAQITVFKPQLLQSQDGTKLVDNLWSRIAEEVSSDTEDISHSAELDVSKNDIHDFSYVLDPLRLGALRQQSHPSILQIHFLWQKFVERVDPMVKILHIPSFQTAIEKATADLDHIPKSFEAIMFSIYSMAVISMTEDECMKSFGESRKKALAFYIGATKMALLRANFMSSTNLVVFQALVLHIFSIRQHHEPRAVWSLTGVALRIAQIMGLFIDGSLLGLSPFETEMRRRLWWQLKHHDSRAAELCGQAKFQLFNPDDQTPRAPMNINDCDLSPSMTQLPAASVKPTEMLWAVILADLSGFASAHKRKMKELKVSSGSGSGLRSEEYSALDDIRGKDTISEEIEELMETKYLRFCDPSKPLQLMALIGCRAATDFIRFISHHPRRWTQSHVDSEEKQIVWNLCLQIFDRTMMMQSMSRLQRFAWIVPYFLQWSVVIHILDTLRMEPFQQDADKAWELIDTLYKLNMDILLSMDRPVYIAIGSLSLKAYLARPAPLDGQVPGYITELRNYFQKPRSKTRNSTMEGRDEHRGAKENTSHLMADSNHGTDTDFSSLNDLPGVDDAFWLEFGGGLDPMSSDLDRHGLTSDNNLFDFSKDSAWDWTQWDTLISTNRPF